MNDAAIHYQLEHIDNLRYLLCLVQELSGETGMLPTELKYHGYTLGYCNNEANAVIKGAMSEDAYIARNIMALPCQD